MTPAEIDKLLDELKYLRWFHANTDFGPADSDVRHYLDQAYIKNVGPIPEGYGED